MSLLLLAATSLEVSRTLFLHLGSPHAAVLLSEFEVLHTERCAVFLSPPVQLNVHVGQTSMLSIDVRSPRSDAECRGGDRQGAFNRTQRNFKSALSLRVNMGSRSRWGNCIDLFCRDMSPGSAYWSALMDPAAELNHSAPLIPSWLSHREDANRLFWDGPACIIAV